MPLSWVLGALALALVAAAQLQTALHGPAGLVPYLLLPAVVVAAALASRGQVRVEDGVLHVPGARAPLSAFGPPELVTGPEIARWQSDASAWVATRPWSRAAVRLPVVDPEDDTPYWLVGTKDPVALMSALS